MTVVLLHALPLDERMWAGFDGVAPRLYGPGSSFEEWATALLGALEGELVLVGASMGGYCALAMARLAPERIRGLALVGSRPDADTPERRAGRAATLETIRAEGAPGLWAAMRPKVFSEEAGGEAVERARTIALEQPPDDLAAAVEAIRDRPDSTAVWRSLRVPTLVAVGSADPFVAEADARAFAGDAELHVLAGCGHLPALERPDELRPVLAAFVERCR